MRARNLLVSLLAVFALAACSSDEPVVDDGGNNGGNGQIPASQLDGQWNYDKYYYTLEVDDQEVYTIIKDRFVNDESNTNRPKAGRLKFFPGEITTSFPGVEFEGNLLRNWVDLTSTLEDYGNYYTKGDSIFCSTGIKWVVLIKNNNRITYNYDLTEHYGGLYPDAGVKKAIYYVDYVKK